MYAEELKSSKKNNEILFNLTESWCNIFQEFSKADKLTMILKSTPYVTKSILNKSPKVVNQTNKKTLL